MRFNGEDYQPERDDDRLTGQIKRIWEVMRDGKWHTVQFVASVTGDPETSVSAQIRHLRKSRFGGHKVDRRRHENGLSEFKLDIEFKKPVLVDPSGSEQCNCGKPDCSVCHLGW